ncbi:MAG TPA: heparinase II/III family protein [Azospira sp.]|nr:heparinase II/III family protein [Azospira sp.]
MPRICLISICRQLPALLLGKFGRAASTLAGILVISAATSGASLAATTASCVPVTTADWMVTSNQLAAPIRPTDCSWVTQTPPDFGWPDISSDAKYQVTLTYPDGHTNTQTAPQNWINWPEVLPAGYYAWTVTVTNSTGTKTSLARHFTVDPSASTFLVPSGATLYSKIVAKAHPRSLPDATTLATMISQRPVGVKAVLANATNDLSVAPAAQPSSTSVSTNWYTASDECKRTLNMALAWVISKNTQYLSNAVLRLKNLASWDPNGTTSYTVYGMDMGARQITWTMALVYDWLWPQLDSTTKSQVLTVLQTRTAVMYNDVIGTRSRVATSPRDSHGALTVTILGGISTILAGDLSSASTWLAGSLPQAANAVSPWGGDDSGHANGTTQGSWDMGDSLVPWYVFRWAGGIDVAQKAWMRNWSNFIAYMIPPGTPVGNFGDGAEKALTENWSRFGKAYTWFAPSPLGRWYASQPSLQGGDTSRIEMMLAPPADFTTGAYPLGTPNTAVFRDIGWAAMHSDLSNPSRVSIYFKSSPLGSFNHSHADQNSFVINAGGQRLAIDSGYYDAYKTSHWYNWYKQTRAHNAITFDGGQGQTVFELSGKLGPGQITGYVHGSNYELLYGDATAAYAGLLQTAKRALVYFPPNLLLVYDNLASATARQWEWNIHAVNQMSSTSGTQATIQNGGQTLCVNILGGPTTAFRQTNAFTANPTGSWTAQWHGTFYSTTQLTATEFVTLLNVGCTSVAASASKSGTAWTVNVGSNTVTINGGVVTVGTPTTTTSSTGTTSTSTTTTTTTTTSTGTTSGTTTSTAPAPAPTSTPYTGKAIAVPATFEAENYDKGGEGVAYHDLTKGNTGGVYRTSEDVDLVASCDSAGGGYVVNSFQTGEWMNYTIAVPTTANYEISVKAASNYSTAGAFHAEIDGKNVTGSVTSIKTGNWCTFKWFGKTGIPLTAGTHILKIYADAQYFNVNQVRVLSSK